MTERNETCRSASAGSVRSAAGGFFSPETQGSAKRSHGGFGGKPPLKGGGFPPNPPPIEDGGKRDAAAAWLADNLPTVAAFATAMRAEFGDVRLVWAKEAGHEIGRSV